MHDVWSLNKMLAKTFNLYLLQGHTNEYLALKSSSDGISDCVFSSNCKVQIVYHNEYNSLSIQFEERKKYVDLWLVPHRLIDPLNKGVWLWLSNPQPSFNRYLSLQGSKLNY